MSQPGTKFANHKTRERAFLHYVETGSLSAIARKFKVAVSSVHALADREHWTDRHNRIIAESKKRTDSRLAKLHAKLLSRTSELADKIFDRLVGIDDDDFEATISDFERLVKLQLKLAGGDDTKITIKVNIVASAITKAFVIALNQEVRNPGERARVQTQVMATLGKLDIGGDIDVGSDGEGEVTYLPPVGRSDMA